MLALSTAFDGRLFASRDVWSLPRRGGWWHEMRYTRVNWGERDTFEHDFRMKRQTFHLLLEILKPHISANDRMEGVRASVDAETRLAVALVCFFRVDAEAYGDLFGISRQSAAKFCNIPCAHSQCATISSVPRDYNINCSSRNSSDCIHDNDIDSRIFPHYRLHTQH